MTDEWRGTADATRAAELGSRLKIGDLVFIEVKPKPFHQVSIATGSRTNHVGVVIDATAEDPMIAQSTFPFSRQTALTRLVNRSRRRKDPGNGVAIVLVKFELGNGKIFTHVDLRARAGQRRDPDLRQVAK